MNKIPWTTDGSKEAEAANSEIIGLHVIKVIDKKISALLGERVDLTGWVGDAAGKWFDLFDRIQEELKGENLKFAYKVVAGSPHEKIIQVANEEKVDLIVMGKRGLGLVDRILAGSNTIRVLKQSRVAVLVAKEGVEKSLRRIKEIIVPFDVYEKLSSALRYAIFLGRIFDAIVSVVYVLKLVTDLYPLPVSILNKMRC